MVALNWHLSNRADPRAVAISDAHYSRQKPGTPQFMPPGSAFCLFTEGAVWGTSAPLAAFVKHDWAGAWMCSIFRREPECPYLASDLIREAVAATRWRYGEPPALGMVTFVDAGKVRSANPGFCFKKAGFRRVGETKGGLLAFQLLPAEMPPAEPPLGVTLRMEVA